MLLPHCVHPPVSSCTRAGVAFRRMINLPFLPPLKNTLPPKNLVLMWDVTNKSPINIPKLNYADLTFNVGMNTSLEHILQFTTCLYVAVLDYDATFAQRALILGTTWNLGLQRLQRLLQQTGQWWQSVFQFMTDCYELGLYGSLAWLPHSERFISTLPLHVDSFPPKIITGKSKHENLTSLSEGIWSLQASVISWVDHVWLDWPPRSSDVNYW